MSQGPPVRRGRRPPPKKAAAAVPIEPVSSVMALPDEDDTAPAILMPMADEDLEQQHHELALIAESIEGLVPVSEIEPIRAVPTLLPGFNRASQLGGAPIRCIHVTHGPTHAGKSLLEMVKAISFQRLGHLVVIIDSEHVFDKRFFAANGGVGESMLLKQPDTYERTVRDIDLVIKNFATGKEKGKIHPDRALLLVVDTINKLVPKALLEKVMAEEKIESKFRIGGMLRALMNQGWLDHLTPVVGKYDVALALVAQERQDSKDGGGRGGGPAFVHGDAWKVKGGSALAFDNSLQVRVTHAGMSNDGTKDKPVIVGKRHRVRVIKNKVGYPNETFIFFTADGKHGVPVGIDFQRSAYHEADERGWVDTSGAWKSVILPGHEDPLVRGQGVARAVAALRDETDAFAQLVEALNLR